MSRTARARWPARIAATMLALCGLCAGLPALAQTAEPPGAAQNQAEGARMELEDVKREIALSKSRAEALRREIEQLEGDRDRQNAALIAAGQRVKLAEIEVDDVEARLARLLEEESEIRTRLNSADIDVGAILAALQRIGKSPPPALIVRPEDALGAARGALMLKAVLPQLKGRADLIAADLARLSRIREAARAEEETLRANLAVLNEEQLRIATLIEARRRGLIEAGQQLTTETEEAEALAARATSLSQLIKTLTERIDAVGQAAAAAGASAPPSPADAEAIRVALARTDRSSPAVPFPALRGFLAVPTAGVPVAQFGMSDGFGSIMNGASYVTRAGAAVVAPADGWVMYKGPYLNYGQIVILNPGQSYSILLAGLGSIDVELGQFVRLGEPIGTMGQRTSAPAILTKAGASRPTLYIELRDATGPIDPTGWLAPATARG